MRRSLAVLFIACLWSGAAACVNGQTSYPMVMSIHPAAAQIGSTTEHRVSARYSLEGTYQVAVSGTGVTAEVVPAEDNDEEPMRRRRRNNQERLKLRITVAPDAVPGIRDFRLATPSGASTVGQLVITRGAVIPEADKNDDITEAQAVTFPATLCGRIEKAEDIDVYKFTAPAGAAYTFHVQSARLENRIHDLQEHVDPILTLRNASGSVVASSDNYFFADSLLAHRFEQAGEYYLELRDVRYKGNRDWTYCIEVSDQPFVEVVHPLAATRGSTAQLELLGPNIAPGTVAHLNLSADAPLGFQTSVVDIAPGFTAAVPLLVSDLPQYVETGDTGGMAEQAQSAVVPGGISGRVGAEQDVDCYRFEAKKGDRFTFEVFARRCQSKLDAHLRVLNHEGAQLALNDDAGFGKRMSADARIDDWTAPADGSYLLEIRDLHLRGGAEYVYHLQATVARPRFALYLDTDKTNLTPGTSGILFVRAERLSGFDGEIALRVEGLPPGVSASCGRILPGTAVDGCIVFEAAPDAPQAMANIQVTGEAIQNGEPPVTLTAKAVPYQEIYVPGGGRGHYPVETHAVAVGAPSDIRSVALSTQELNLAPGQSQRIDVKIERAAEFAQNITLDVYYRHLGSMYGDSLPPGVTLDERNSVMLLTGTESEAHLTFTAAPNAPPVEKQQIAIMANVSINFVMKATYASKPLLISVPSATAEATASVP